MGDFIQSHLVRQDAPAVPSATPEAGISPLLLTFLVGPTTPFTANRDPVGVLFRQGFELNDLEVLVVQGQFTPPIQNRVYTSSWFR